MDERSEEYRRLEKEYEFLSNLINSHRNKKSAQAEELEALPRSGFSVAKGGSPKQSQSQHTVSISRRNRPQRGGIGSDRINPLQCLATNEKSQQCLNLQTLDKGHQYVKKNNGCSDQLYAINKYKFVRPHSETTGSLSVPSGCQSSQTHADCTYEKLVKPSSLLCNSTKLLNSCRSAKDVIVHKSKYKLVKSDHTATDVSMRTLKSSQNLTKNIDYKNGTFSSTTGFGAVKCRLGRASSGSVTATVASPYKTIKRSVTTSLGSRHQMRKANKMPLLPKGQLGRNAYAANSSRTLFANSRPKGSWITKYSLQRQHGEVRNQDNCINMILGRKVSNLSSNKYKFINARRPVQSPRSSARYTFKRKLLANDRLPSSKSTRYSWHTRYRLTVRKLNYSDLRRPLKRRKSYQHTSTESPAGDVGVRYCLYYNRFGRCSRGDSCQFIHDPDKITICTRFLRGTCKITDCPFSHTVAKHKMPTCRFFLRRACHREDCPYLHVNVGKDAEICLDFPRGLCTNGDLCKKKHMLICLDFSDNGTCPRGNSCPMQHPKKQQKPDVCKKVATKPQCSLASADKASIITSVNALHDPGESSLPDDDVTLEWKERCLPSFIALNNSVENSPHQSTVGESGNSKCLIIHPRLKTYDARIKMVESIIQQSSQDF